MLKFNPKRVFALRGVEKKSGFLVRLGFTYPQATKFLKAGKPTIKVSHIEQLCVALNCTPNDLFEWKTDQNTILPGGHSLNALNRGEEVKNLQQMVKDVPSDKLALIENLLDALKP
ncbi:MAG: helix-turn-helix transcriptional regulator [Pyrinomonadaceae bacterium]